MAKKTQEELWLEEACGLIRGNTGLQFFFQSIFENGGLYSLAPIDPNLRDGFEGQRALALSIKETLDAVDPLLFSELLLARTTYLTEQAESDDAFE